MNHSSLKNAPLFKDNGIGKESEEVWIEWTGHDLKTGEFLFYECTTSRKELAKRSKINNDEMLPALNCEELDDILWESDIDVSRDRDGDWVAESVDAVELLKEAKNPTEAREQALVWFLEGKR